jgi:prepilin-type N-terminal cleavage/methylation domain-containing protein
MRSPTFSTRRAFTLVEIMIVLAIIALLAAMATSSLMRARKRAQAAKILDDLRLLDGALDQYALENNKQTGDIAAFSDLRPYLMLSSTMAVSGVDLFGQPYGPYSVDTGPKVSNVTFGVLSDVAPAEFWSPFH